MVKSQSTISPSIKLADDCQDLLVELQKVFTFIDNNKSLYFHNDQQDKGNFNNKKTQEKLYRFENGIIPQTLKNWAEDLALLSKKSLNSINKLYKLLMEAVKENEVQLYLAEPLLGEAGFMIQRLENLHALWQMYEKTDNEKAAPLARWIEMLEGKRHDFLLSASPIEVGFMMEDMLWSIC